MAALQELPRQSAVDLATTDLRRVILDGEFPVGQKLPAERQLSETLGVHRTTLRCSLSRLEAEGLIKARHGSGYEVLDFLRTANASLIAPLLERPADDAKRRAQATDLLLLRRHLAAALFERLAALEAPDFGPTTEAINALEDAIDGSLESFARADLAVVDALVSATESAVLSLCVHPISSVLLSWPALMRAMYRDRNTNVERWRGVVEFLSAPKDLDAPTSDMTALVAAFDAETLAALDLSQPSDAPQPS